MGFQMSEFELSLNYLPGTEFSKISIIFRLPVRDKPGSTYMCTSGYHQ